MPYSFHFISLYEPEQATAELNRFVAEHRVVSVDRQFLPNAGQSGWAVSLQYRDGAAPQASRFVPGKRDRIDYMEILNKIDFAVFARLRALRKARADSASVPAYRLFTDEQLAEMVKRRTTTEAALREIEGVGDAKVAQHGEAFLQILREAELPPLAADET
jgi:superfamily II DNA helicase RecQ